MTGSAALRAFGGARHTALCDRDYGGQVRWQRVPNLCGRCGEPALVYTTDFQELEDLPPAIEQLGEAVGLVRCQSCGYQAWVHGALPA